MTPQAIIDPHQQATWQRSAEQSTVLFIQDTTAIDLTHHAKTEGLGYLEREHLRGFFQHSTLAATEQGVPLGLIDLRLWHRPEEQYGQKHTRKSRPFDEKESQRWQAGVEACQGGLRPDQTGIVIADREADIWEVFTASRPANLHLLIRLGQDRRVVITQEEGEQLSRVRTLARELPAAGSIEVSIAHSDNRPTRTAKVDIAWCTCQLLPPRRSAKAAALNVQLVVAREQNPPKGSTAIEWILLTTQPVESWEEAIRCVRFYQFRWLIERFHYVLKSGCQVEQLQLQTRERLENALALYCIVAWRLLWLTYQARVQPQEPCTAVLEKHEWQALHAFTQKGKPLPAEPPTLEQAVVMIARLGGFLNRKSDGAPGVKVIWRGLRRLADIAETWLYVNEHLVQHPPPKNVGNG